MAQSQGWVRRYFKAFCKGFFVAVPVAVTFLDQVACVARVEGTSMQPSLNPGGSQSSDVVLLNHWKVRNFEVQRGDIVSLVASQVTLVVKNSPAVLEMQVQSLGCEDSLKEEMSIHTSFLP
ncbi:mitochondrial inner membrane protease subunit 2 isoform X3 [Ovis aries]|uniref:mitochondrial inner membrane protease subunit 2 isoform X3 n=1 Tax=Ovis aries TaxID=9940 RepID=UPI0029528C19|nr:mitochondrial inner membrane protease subunit 2 isoform X3 [Ovis aries]